MILSKGFAMTTPRLLLCLTALAFVASLGAQAPNNAESIQTLRVKNFVMPVFPDYVQLTGNSKGIVTVAIGRDAEGYVTDVLVLTSTHAQLSRSVVDAVKKWKFALPANLAPAGKEIYPVVRFVFSAQGIAVVSALTGSLDSKERADVDDSPVLLPSFANLDSVPQPINHPLPTFTGSAAARAVGSTATVRYFVDEEGKVRVPVVTECSSPEVGQAALSAVEQWTYEPPRAAGHATIALETGVFTFAPSKN
jgi:TonB family protein